jgi:hypothetical protein
LLHLLVVVGEVVTAVLVVMHLAVGATDLADPPAMGLAPDWARRGDLLLAAKAAATSGLAMSGTMGMSDITTNIMGGISSTILIPWPLVFLIDGTLTTGTSTTGIRTMKRITIPRRSPTISFGAIWR